MFIHKNYANITSIIVPETEGKKKHIQLKKVIIGQNTILRVGGMYILLYDLTSFNTKQYDVIVYNIL